MKIYFLSTLPCALTINGVYFGRTDTFGRYAEVCAKDQVFVEFRPENALPIGFFITEKLPFSPPERCEVYLLPDSIAIFAKDFLPCDFTLQVFWQQTLEDVTITLFQQGDRQVCLQKAEEMFVKSLPPTFLPKSARKIGNFYLIEGEKSFCLIDKKAEILLYEKCEEVIVKEKKLHAVLPLCDSRGRKAKCVWDLANGCQREEFTLLQPATENPSSLLAYAFFESVLIGADYTPFLSENLKKEVDKIPSFLGDFLSISPLDDPLSCHLIYQKSERLYEVKTFRVCVEDDKIVDIQG